MSNEENSEDRLTKNEFSELIQHLSIQEILTIEYIVSYSWSKLFSRKNLSFTCNLCAVDTSSFKNLLDHINGKRHKLEMENIKELYHPVYTYPKTDGKQYFEVKRLKNKSASSTAVTFTESDCNDRQENVEKCIYNNTFVKNQEVESKKNIRNRNVIELKPILSKKENITDNDSKEKEIIKEQFMCRELLLRERETNKKLQNNENSVKSKEINKELQKGYTNLNAEKIINNERLTDKSNTALESANNKNKSEKNFSSITNSLSLCNETTECRSGAKVGAKEIIISEEPKKSSQKIAEEENLESDTNCKEIDSKTTKMVINPAAALASKKCLSNLMEKNTCVEENPNYQTDKIIVPTANKNKISCEKQSPSYTPQSHLRDLPKFSLKSYSSKSDDIDVHGLLGVEYVIKILRHRNDSSPRYECGLCELVLDGFAMQRHLEGYNHRLKFCEKHFPTAIRHYRQYMQSVPEHELFKVMTPILQKLAKAIENHHGRNLPYECYERDFSLNRHEILAKAFSFRHASEQYGPTFTHVVEADEVDHYINERQKYTPPTASRFAIFDIKPGESIVKSDSISHQDITNTDKDLISRNHTRNCHSGRTDMYYSAKCIDNSHKSYMSSGLFDDLCPPANLYDQQNKGELLEHFDDKTYNLMVDNFLKGTLKGVSGSSRFREYKKRSASPSSELNSKKRKSLSPLRDNDIWQAYRHMVDQELNNLNEKFKQYRKDPEAHPSYNEEWQKFWKRRKDELISAGLDHRKYNYQPEWVKFIKVRIEEFYNEEVENIKIKCRERLCLPMANSHLLDVKYHVQVATTLKDCPNIQLSDDVRPIIGLVKEQPTWASLKVNAPQVISVLRLMTALEDILGSLGPKIIDLLSKALQAEKSDPTLVNAIILNDENCSLIETAKEKFKGLVFTGLFEGSKQRVLQQVIHDAEDLLKYAHESRQFLSSQRSSASTRSTQSCNSLINRPLNVGPICSIENLLPTTDKKELASKLAASLLAQGKTDFDHQQLQQLLAVYTLIDKKKCTTGYLSSSKETTAMRKKKLSETLSDLLNSSSTSTHNNISSNFNVTQQKNVSNIKTKSNTSATSFNSALQNSGDNYLLNSQHPHLPESACGVNTIRGNQFEHSSSNYTNNGIPYQQNPLMNCMYNNDLYENNRIGQNWMLTSNMEMNSNHDIGRPCSYNQPTNWRNF